MPPELQAFVGILRDGWIRRANGASQFGDEFRDNIDETDKEPVNAAGKLVVAAVRILDPSYSGEMIKRAMERSNAAASSAKVSKTP